jgi:iron complex transport system substrate-binding protein
MMVHKRLWCVAGVVVVLFSSVMAFSEEKVVDEAGRRYVVTHPFKRIISLYEAHTENLVALGLSSEIIGVNDDDINENTQLKKQVFSYHDGPEKFIAAKPDLILIRPMIDRAYSGLFSTLEQNGIVVMSLQPVSVDEMYDYWRVLGLLTGKKDKAEAMVKKFKQDLADILEKTKKLKTKKRVYFESMHHQMKTFSKESMAIFCLESAGGINVAKDAVPSRATNIGIYGKEKILSHAGDIDVFLVQSGRMNQTDVATIKNEPGFNIIKAVKENKIYLIDETLVSRPTPRLIEGVRAIGNILYPDVFASQTRTKG